MTDTTDASEGEGASSLELGTESSFPSSGNVLTTRKVEGEQRPFRELTDQGLKTQSTLHELYLARIRAEHGIAQEAKDNDARREREAKQFEDRRRREQNIFKVVLIGTILGLAIGRVAVILSPYDAVQRWGQSLITLILGALVGYWAATKHPIGDGGLAQS